MASADLLGYLASGLVLGTFCMRSMAPLRLLAIASNLAFICYAWSVGLMPVLVLHAILLPMNVLRLIELAAAQRPELRDIPRRVLATIAAALFIS